MAAAFVVAWVEVVVTTAAVDSGVGFGSVAEMVDEGVGGDGGGNGGVGRGGRGNGGWWW